MKTPPLSLHELAKCTSSNRDRRNQGAEAREFNPRPISNTVRLEMIGSQHPLEPFSRDTDLEK
jgi:hypothetical protein